MRTYKKGERVTIAARATGAGEALEGVVTRVEERNGATFISVEYTSPRKGIEGVIVSDMGLAQPINASKLLDHLRGIEFWAETGENGEPELTRLTPQGEEKALYRKEEIVKLYDGFMGFFVAGLLSYPKAPECINLDLEDTTIEATASYMGKYSPKEFPFSDMESKIPLGCNLKELKVVNGEDGFHVRLVAEIGE